MLVKMRSTWFLLHIKSDEARAFFYYFLPIEA